MITKYDIETPKHFTAIAKSKKIAALGYVIEAQVKKEDFLPTWACICCDSQILGFQDTYSNSREKIQPKSRSRSTKSD